MVRIHWTKPLSVLGAIFLLTFLSTHLFAASTKEVPPPPPNDEATNALAKECSQCHEMKPEVLTWQVSAHDRFACTVCHLNEQSRDFVVQHQTRSYQTPIRIAAPIPNSVCLNCHSANRMVSPSGDLYIPHQQHLNAGVTCVTCHNGVVHGKIAERDLSYILPNPADYEAWNLSIAQEVLTEYYKKPSMWTCLECHKQRNVTRKCGACHTTIPALPSHDQPNWSSQHGLYARTNLQQCIGCHAIPDLPLYIKPSTGDKVADFARAQKLCYQCHLQRPEMHKKSMLIIHSELVSKKGLRNCLTCHDKNKPATDEKVSRVYCNQCHWFDS